MRKLFEDIFSTKLNLKIIQCILMFDFVLDAQLHSENEL